jgi:hypothetical protein
MARGRESELVEVPDFCSRQSGDYPGVFYVIDEAHIHFGARNTLKRSDEMTFFLSQHGHLRTDVMFISQHPSKLDKHIRVDAQDWTVCSNLGNEKGFLGVSLPGLFRRSTYMDIPGGLEKPVETGTFRLRVKEFGSLYSTSAGVGMSGRVDTQETRRGNHWRRWGYAAVGVALVAAVLPLGLMFGLGKGIHKGLTVFMGQASGASERVVTNITAGASSPVAKASPYYPPYSIGPSPMDHGVVNSYGTRLSSSTVFLTGFSAWGLTLDDGSIISAEEGHTWERVPGGVNVDGRRFIPWAGRGLASGGGGARPPAETVGQAFARPLRASSEHGAGSFMGPGGPLGQ